MQNEWTRNLLQDRPELTPERVNRTRRLMAAAVPDAGVEEYQSLIGTLTLPDPDDRHVLAASITSEVDVPVTWELRYFPKETLTAVGIEVLTPDNLVCRVLVMAPQETRSAVEALRVSLRIPPYSWPGVLERFRQVGLVQAAEALSSPTPRRR